jgi:heme-degrading monooxygenase HmoA
MYVLFTGEFQSMILEMAQFEIKPGSEEAFEAAVVQAQPLFLTSKGCKGVRLKRSVESPTRYRLLIEWNTLEDHTVSFRGSENFVQWRALIQDLFVGKPEVEHFTEALYKS